MIKKYPKIYIGPMTKNVVDSVLEFCDENQKTIGFIPSRRQVDHQGGYVNNWTTEQFSKYVSGRLPIERDHGGISQGQYFDDGRDSLEVDAKCLDIVHIDPWKYHQKYISGFVDTLKCIEHVYSINPDVKFEIGTEQSIRPFTAEMLDKLLSNLFDTLDPTVFKNIKYAVIQSGVALNLASQSNVGSFSSNKLHEMTQVCKKYGVLSKEHNGDFLTHEQINMRFKNGLDAINIAPEFGQIETICYLNSNIDFDKFYDICYHSGRWRKWVSEDFIPSQNKRELVTICGHYVLSTDEFKLIKPDIDDLIKDEIKNKLSLLFEECGL
jgi:hypothetical protein